MNLRPIAITLGDPAGVGPEIIVRSWQHPAMRELGSKLVYGNSRVLTEAAQRFAPGLRVLTQAHGSVTSGDDPPDLLRCIEVDSSDLRFDRDAMVPAQVSAATGDISYRAIVRACQDVLAKKCRGLVTLPISKWAWHQAGYCIPGHTELLAELCHVHDSSMMLFLKTPRHPAGLGVVHVTLHVSVREALDMLDTRSIVAAGRKLQDLMRKFARHYNVISEPCLGVCAVNPHAGEKGLFGREELDLIAPAVEDLQRLGCHASGPYPADTLFARAAAGEFDGVVAMYHDQGHIAIKLLTMFDAVNITLGLPIVRTSVAHGTAEDIAWQGKGRIEGFLRAMEVCSILAAAQSAEKRHD